MVTPVLAVLLAACLAQQPGEESTRSPVPRSAGASYVLFDRNRDWPPATQITGRIVDVAGRPLADAALELRERAPDRSRAVSSGSSGVDGRFELGVKPGGAHGESEHPLFLLVDAPALARSHVELRFSAYALPAELGDVVVYPPVALAGRVVDERGAPIAGADVFAVLGPRAVPYGDFAGMAPLATTDADGRYACRELPPGRVTLGVRAAGRADRVREDVRLDGAQPNAVDFVLLDEDVRVLRLTGPLGEPLVGASARLPGDYDRFGLGTGDAPWAFFRTSLAADKRGWIRVEGLAKGVSRRLVFEAHGYAPLSLRTDASEDVRLAPVTWIDVRTQRKGGGPAPELFQLSVRDDTTSPSWCGNCEDNHWQDLYADSPAVQRVAADHWRFAWNHPTCYVDGGRPQKISAVATDTSRALFEWEVPPAAGSPST
ncbi:MAG: carboxypeptidase regulatory-like domain-containing protein [Planctomycetota bacterium]|nr:MAG: carboxypeptidase regulatory-like domain-containing protein [Planctomycetota bacterium]